MVGSFGAIAYRTTCNFECWSSTVDVFVTRPGSAYRPVREVPVLAAPPDLPVDHGLWVEPLSGDHSIQN
jgi:hypothetical protein